MAFLGVRLTFMIALLGCAPMTTTSVVSPASTRATVRSDAVTTCPNLARVEFRERREDGSSASVALHCGASPRLEIDEMYASGEGGSEPIDIEREVADRIWRVVVEQSWRDWDSCEPSDAFPRWHVEVSDGSRYLNQVECRGELPEAWQLSFDALNEVTGVDTGELYWPFDGEYWTDELGYYRNARR